MESLKSSAEAALVLHFREFMRHFVLQFQPLQIYIFAQNTYTEDSQGCFNAAKVDIASQYCLLVVMETATRVDYEMQDFANTHYLQGKTIIICHGQQSMMDAIKHNSRFFITVLSNGKLVYSQDGILTIDQIPSYIPTDGAIKATKQYAHRIALAEGFLLCAAECLQKGQFGICAFMLHQAVEQTCICLIRVHIAYRSEFHNLYRLLYLCQSFSNRPIQLFLSTPEDKRLFEIMAKSYSGSRYKDDFTVSRQDAESLHQRVLSFVEVAKEMCHEKIEMLDQEAAQYVTLREHPHVQLSISEQMED